MTTPSNLITHIRRALALIILTGAAACQPASLPAAPVPAPVPACQSVAVDAPTIGNLYTAGHSVEYSPTGEWTVDGETVAHSADEDTLTLTWACVSPALAEAIAQAQP